MSVIVIPSAGCRSCPAMLRWIPQEGVEGAYKWELVEIQHGFIADDCASVRPMPPTKGELSVEQRHCHDIRHIVPLT